MKYQCDSEKLADLKGLSVLFFAPAFFGYEYKMADKMRELGADVDLFDERSVTSSLDRALLKLSPKIFRRKSQRYYDNIIKGANKNYDVIFVIKGEMIPTKTLKELRKTYPNARINLYLYDSVANVPGILSKIEYFDKCHSFDPEDCEKYDKLIFEPLFYADEYCEPVNNVKEYKYDLCFLGTIHSDRYKIIKQVQKMAKQLDVSTKWFLYLQSKFMFYFYKMTKKEFWNTTIDDFDFEKKNSSELAEIVENTNIVIDIQHPKQKGLTMRTIEMLGMNKKLITTNATIKNYDFYNKNNICVIDRENVQIDMDFLNSDYQEIDKDIYENYSLESWIKTVLS